ncbi:MAG: dihydroorotase [Rhodospirillales bacterium]|nr:dihydroorotase [Rhodospirillales bacterium]
MPGAPETVLVGGTIVTRDGLHRADVAIRDGVITAVGREARGGQQLDITGLTVLPGVIDSQVHFREPGHEHKENLESGTRAAVLGGVCSVFEMPNTSPPTTSAEALDDKLRRARGRAWADHAFFVGASHDNIDDLAELERLPGCAGVKIFMGSSTGTLLVPDDPSLARVLASGTRRCAIHAEDQDRLEELKALVRDGASVEMHPQVRDPAAALLATRRILGLARAAGRPVHVLHISTADELPLLAAAKDIATAETTPNHLTLTAPQCYVELGTRAQMNPPVRDRSHQDALWEQGIRGGAIDVIGSDHAPHTLEEKALPYPRSPSGMPGTQTLLPVMLDHAQHGRLTLERLADLTSGIPARIYGARGKGAVAVGYDADLTIVDLNAERTIRNDWIASPAGWTPFDGKTVRGWPIMTMIRGHLAMREDEVLGTPMGRPVTFATDADG